MMTDLDKRADELTNPDILTALEIAPVPEWDEQETYHNRSDPTQRIRGLASHYGKIQRPAVVDEGKYFVRWAVPADLDHALVPWLEYIGQTLRKRNPGELVLVGLERWESDKAVRYGVASNIGDVDDGDDTTAISPIPVVALAAAVVKVGKPAEEKTVTIRGPIKSCTCGCTQIRHHLLNNGSIEIQCADCHRPRPTVIPGPQDPPRPKKRNRYA